GEEHQETADAAHRGERPVREAGGAEEDRRCAERQSAYHTALLPADGSRLRSRGRGPLRQGVRRSREWPYFHVLQAASELSAASNPERLEPVTLTGRFARLEP